MRRLLRPFCWLMLGHRWQIVGAIHVSPDGNTWSSEVRCSRCSKTAVVEFFGWGKK